MAILHLVGKTLADFISGKTPEEIRERFRVTKDFEPDVEKSILKENACFKNIIC